MSFLHSAGTAAQTGMGLVPLTWQEIYAWAKLSGLEESLSPWEMQVIKTLSEEYVAEHNKATDKRRPQPYTEVEVIEEHTTDKQDLAKKFQTVLSEYIKK